MKLVKTANGKQIVKMSKKEWQSAGEEAGWLRKAQDRGFADGDGVDTNNPDWIAQQLRTYLGDQNSFWSSMEFQTGEDYSGSKSKYSLIKDMLLKLKSVSPTLEMLSKDEQKSIARGLMAIRSNIEHEEEIGIGAEPQLAGHGGETEQATPTPTEDSPELNFATPREIEEIRNQLLDRYINREITEDQLKNALTEFAKKHNLNIKLSKSNGRIQVRIASKKTA